MGQILKHIGRATYRLEEKISWDGCPKCGDTLQEIRCQAPDHGNYRPLILAWCMDCRDVMGILLLDSRDS